MKMTIETKRKVMAMGNRLTAKFEGDRRAAFVKAWELVKKSEIEICVNGVTFANRQEVLKRLAKYEPAQIKTVLVPEPDNKFDKNAIAVKVGVNFGKGLFTIGYIPKTFTAVVNAIGSNLPALKVLSGDIFGARLALAV